jgi:hypothetical protein
MTRKKALIGILLVLSLAGSIITITQSNFVSAAEPAKLKIYIGPNKIPADNSIYECIFVQLQDSSSRPTRAVEDTTISLSSSLTSVGTVDPTITIPRGETFAVAKFDSTFTPGSTAIAATASGFATVQATMVTIAPVPYKLALYGFPAVLPADGIPYEALVVQLQDSGSNPAKAPLGGVAVTLFSSDEAIATAANSVLIYGGQTHTLANVTGISAGTATFTAMASGYISAQTTIATQTPMANPPARIRLYSAPPKIMADNTGHPQIAIQLLDATGKITQQPSTSTLIQLSSSNVDVGDIESIIEVPEGKVFATALFSTTYRAGKATITAATSGLQTDTETVTTIGPIPSKLVVYCNPSVLPADNKEYTGIQIQLQDASGKPALDPNGDVTVSLFSSEPKVGTVPSTVTIPYGTTYATALIKSTYLASSTSITAQSSGYTTGQATMRTYQIDPLALTAAITADPINVTSGEQTEIIAYVTDPAQNPVEGATVEFNSSIEGELAKVQSLENGRYTTIFTAPIVETQTSVTITTTVSKTDCITTVATAKITVLPEQLYGILQIIIRDTNSLEPVSNVTVFLISKTSDSTSLTATTNSTGYTEFSDCMEGDYTVNLDKQGYIPMNTTIDFKSTSGPINLSITQIGDDQSTINQTIVWLVLVVVIVVSAIALVMVIRRRRKQTPNFIAAHQ